MPDASGVRAGRAFVELGSNDSGLVRGLDAAKRKLISWSQSLNARWALAWPLSGAARIGAAFAAVLNSASSGEQLFQLSGRLSESVENLSALEITLPEWQVGTSAPSRPRQRPSKAR